jgi:hypothetical protein
MAMDNGDVASAYRGRLIPSLLLFAGPPSSLSVERGTGIRINVHRNYPLYGLRKKGSTSEA